EPKFAQKIWPPSGFNASCTGVFPTCNTARRWSLVSVGSCFAAHDSGAAASATTITPSPPEQAMNAFDESGKIAMSVAPGQPGKAARNFGIGEGAWRAFVVSAGIPCAGSMY